MKIQVDILWPRKAPMNIRCNTSWLHHMFYDYAYIDCITVIGFPDDCHVSDWNTLVRNTNIWQNILTNIHFKLRVIHPVVQEYNLYLLSVIHNSLLQSKNYAISTKAISFDPMGSSSGLWNMCRTRYVCKCYLRDPVVYSSLVITLYCKIIFPLVDITTYTILRPTTRR